MPDRLGVPIDEIQVCRVAFDDRVPPLSAIIDVLDVHERTRLESLHPTRRLQYAISHLALRDVLGRTIGASARRLVIKRWCARCRQPHGKPYLASPPSQVTFSLSHSGDFAVIAVAAGRAVGVDIERLDARVRVDDLARRLLSSRERCALAGCRGTDVGRRCLEAWSVREAFGKATGRGVPGAMNDPVASSLALDLWEHDRERRGARTRWRVDRFEVAPDYSGVVVADRPPWTVTLWDWSWSGDDGG